MYLPLYASVGISIAQAMDRHDDIHVAASRKPCCTAARVEPVRVLFAHQRLQLAQAAQGYGSSRVLRPLT
jgi:hypothetical protein